jgi:hypothetical protein
VEEVMAILRSLDGTFYEVPDDQVSKYKIPQEKLKEKLGTQAYSAGPPSSSPPPEGGGSSPLVNVHIHYGEGSPSGEGAVSPYWWHHHHHHHHHWHNWHNWRNWRNDSDWRNWRNHWD